MWEVVNGDGTAGRQPACSFPASRWAARPAPRRCARSPAASAARAGDWKYRDHGLFVCFAPTDNPRYAGSVVIEHGLGGARAAAPVAKDVLTYLFDQEKAMAAPRRARDSNGAERWPSAPRGARPQFEAHRQGQCGAQRMISSAIIPQPLARLPWRLIFLVALDLHDRPDHALFGGRRVDVALGAEAGA